MPAYTYNDFTGVPYSANSIPSTGKYLYTETDRRFWFYQPNLVRWRHRWRGPRESLKINQELGQTVFDIYNLKQKKDSLRKTTQLYLDYYLDGWDFDSNIDFNWELDAEPSDSAAEFIGYSELIARVESLRKRVKRLEA